MDKKFALTFAMWASVFLVFAQFSGGGTGTQEDPYGIVTPSDLDNLRNFTGIEYSDTYFQLLNDIDLHDFLDTTVTGWKPIGLGNEEASFYGKLLGNYHTIKNLWMYYYQVTDTDYGFFISLTNSYIENLTIQIQTAKYLYVYKTSTNTFNIGILAASAQSSTCINCHTTGAIWCMAGRWNTSFISSQTHRIGGLLGTVSGNNSNIHACSTSVSINDTIGERSNYGRSAIIGGLIGSLSGQDNNISNCYTVIDVSLSEKDVFDGGGTIGGLIGNLTGARNTINKCYSYNKSIIDCFYYSGVKYCNVGGLLGLCSNKTTGDENVTTISNCYTLGYLNIRGTYVRASGITGFNESYEARNCVIHRNCYTAVKIVASAYNNNLNRSGISGFRTGYGEISY